MKRVEFSLPYFDSFRPIKGKNQNTRHPFAKALVEFQWRITQVKMFLAEIEHYTSKLDKRITMRVFGYEFRIPAVGVNDSIKNDLIRNRQEVERMISDSMIIILVSILEYSLRDFCTALRISKNLKLSWNELRGEPLDQFKTYFEKVGGEEIVISNEDWEVLKAIDRLRNTLAHSLGEMRDKDKPILERLGEKYPKLKITDGSAFPNLKFATEIVDKVNIIFSQCFHRIAHPEFQDIMKKAREASGR
jgi:hypothetical protein